VGTVIGPFVPLNPVVASLIVIAAAGRARRYCANGLARRSIGGRGGSIPARAAPAELTLTRPEPKSGERAGMAAISLNPFQTSFKKVKSGCIPDAKADSR
jgi:hypothetical protein